MAGISSQSGESWQLHTQRIRRMQRLQVIALALMCVGSILVAVIVGRVLLASTEHQRQSAADARALMDARTSILTTEVYVLRSQNSGKPLTAGDFARLLGQFQYFRSSTLGLVERKAGGSAPAAVQARARVGEEIARLDTQLAPLITGTTAAPNLTKVVGQFSENEVRITDALDQWMAAAQEEYARAVSVGEDLANRLFWATILLMGSLGVLAWGWWVLLERARKRMTDAVSDSERRFRSLVQNSSDAVVVVDAEGMIQFATPPVELMFGLGASDLLDSPVSRLVHPHATGPMAHLAAEGIDVLLGGETIVWQGVHSDGTTRYLETIATNMLDDPAIAGVVLNTRDVSDRHEAEMTLAYRANHDPLTDLANRAMFEHRVDRVLAQESDAGLLRAVLILDLDDFKTVNDSLGHGAGDALLIEVAHRLRLCLRSVDMAARFGGDEFAVLLEGTHNRAQVEALAQRLVDAIAEPMVIEGRELEVHASIGIALIDRPDCSASSLIRDADVAMYVAKGNGRAGFVVFDPSMSKRASERLGLIADLRRAAERGEISLAFQPIVSLRHNRIDGVEALLRWNHPTRGAIPPTRFVELAEETGQIKALGTWVLNQAVDEIVSLGDRIEAAADLHLAINVSMRQLEQEDFADLVGDALRRSGFPSHRLMVEITETALMREPETMLRQLQLLKALGVAIAIDDFGTGYSSLAYLARLPIDIVKIDRSFVEGIGATQRDTRIANMIMRIGESLSLITVAEGVERPKQLQALQQIGCEMAQGYLFGKPVSSAELGLRLRASGLAVTADAVSDTTLTAPTPG